MWLRYFTSSWGFGWADYGAVWNSGLHRTWNIVRRWLQRLQVWYMGPRSPTLRDGYWHSTVPCAEYERAQVRDFIWTVQLPEPEPKRLNSLLWKFKGLDSELFVSEYTETYFNPGNPLSSLVELCIRSSVHAVGPQLPITALNQCTVAIRKRDEPHPSEWRG